MGSALFSSPSRWDLLPSVLHDLLPESIQQSDHETSRILCPLTHFCLGHSCPVDYFVCKAKIPYLWLACVHIFCCSYICVSGLEYKESTPEPSATRLLKIPFYVLLLLCFQSLRNKLIELLFFKFLISHSNKFSEVLIIFKIRIFPNVHIIF